MKKAYIKPTVEVIESGDIELLAGSIQWSPDGKEKIQIMEEDDSFDGSDIG